MGAGMQCKGVTIGIPLYNEEKYIEEAIRSAASQCETVWVSDNASTDGSASICERVSREYPNVHFVRQPHNMGAVSNFRFVLDKADTPFFMWLGGHDALPDDYVRQLTQLLEDCPDAVLAYGTSRLVDLNGKPIGDYDYFYHEMLADRSPTTRVLGLIRHLSDCSLIHGIFRTEALRAAWHATGVDAFLGVDHVLLTLAAIKGPFVYAPETCLIRRNAHPADTPQEQVKRMDPRQRDKEQVSYQEMQRRQYALAATASKDIGLSGFLFRLMARFYLVERFGPFGETFIARELDSFLRNNSRWINGVARRIEHKSLKRL
ncbi:MAG: glycosyltransferase family 2 protein [Gallionellaceae bacterium]